MTTRVPDEPTRVPSRRTDRPAPAGNTSLHAPAAPRVKQNGRQQTERNVSKTMAGWLVGCALLAGAAPVAAATGPFTKAQAEDGQVKFNNNCAQCHRPNLKGALGPSLIDDRFKGHFAGKPVADLRGFIYNNMPQNAPKSLSDDLLDPIVAWILFKNGVQPGDTPLTKDAATAPFPK